MAFLMLPDSLRSEESKALAMKLESVIFESCALKNGRMEMTVNKEELGDREIPEIYFDILKQEICDYNWILSPDYVEVIALFFSDGTYMVVYDSLNTEYYSRLEFETWSDGTCHYQGKQIATFAHTHNADNIASDADKAFRDKYPNLGHAIFHNGAFHYF